MFKRKIKFTIGFLCIGHLAFSQETRVDPEKEFSSVVSNKHEVSSFYNRMNVGVLGGSKASPSFHIINGYDFNPHWSAGVGLGIEMFNSGLGYIPIFAEGNYNFLKSRTSPWVNVMAGYELPIRNINNNKGGLTAGGNLGFTYFMGEHVGVSTSVGYRYTYLRDETNWIGWEEYVTISHIYRYEFRVGFVFK